jgi:hypothetical protein
VPRQPSLPAAESRLAFVLAFKDFAWSDWGLLTVKCAL